MAALGGNKYGLSPVDVDEVDLERFPLTAANPYIEANVEPGDGLYEPDSWCSLIATVWVLICHLPCRALLSTHQLKVWWHHMPVPTNVGQVC